MTRWIRAALLGIGVLVIAPAAANAATIFIDFEGMLEATTPAVSGVTFTNATVLTASSFGGSTLNDADFPPTSGGSVAGDIVSIDLTTGDVVLGGPMILVFSNPIASFSGWFSYNTALTLTGLNGVTPVASANSAAGSNLGSSELISLAFAGGITRVEILGDPAGGSFTVDDITAEEAVVVAPEPASMWLLGLGTAALVRRRAKHAA